MNLAAVSPGESEFLSKDELKQVTGRRSFRDQIEVLKKRRWKFEVSEREEILVGRLYCRLRLCGVDLSKIEISDSIIKPILENVP